MIRAFKIVFGLALLALLIAAVAPALLTTSSSDALVSAPLSRIDSPINGTVVELSVGVGDRVAAGTVVGRVTDAVTPHPTWRTLLAEAERHRASAAAVARRIAALEADRDRLAAEAETALDHHRRTQEADLSGARAEAAALALEAEEAARAADRLRELRRTDAASVAALDTAVTTARATAARAQAARRQVARLEQQLAAIRDGVLPLGSGQDVPYARRRLDEVRLQLEAARTEREIELALATESQARAEVQREAAAMVESQPLTAWFDGSVVAVQSLPGSRVGAGDAIVFSALCDRQLVLAGLTENQVSAVRPGGRAKVWIADGAELPATVRAVLAGGRDGPAADQYAVIPRHSTRTVALAVVAVEGLTEAPCAVGKAAHVRFLDPESVGLTAMLAGLGRDDADMVAADADGGRERP